MTRHSSRKCVACESNDLFDFYKRRGVPADTGTLAKTAEEAKTAACGDLALEFCRNCGAVHNRAFDPGLIQFSNRYDASLCHSQSFAEELTETAERLIREFQLNEKSILEIGCGQAHLLRAICERTSVNTVGIDPTVCDGVQEIGRSRLRLIRSGLRRTHQELIGDLVICVSVLEDIEEPLNFLRMLRAMIGDRKLALYFELFDGFGSLEYGNVWSPHYEQCNYFSADAVCQLFNRANFKVNRSGRLNRHKEYLYIEAEPSDDEIAGSIDLSEEFRAVERFPMLVQFAINSWSTRLGVWSDLNKRVFLWGSGGKAISFLNLIPEAETIQGVVDVNPNRQGLYTPKSAKRIVSPVELKNLRPDVIIVSNSAYYSEIAADLDSLGLDCQLIVA